MSSLLGLSLNWFFFNTRSICNKLSELQLFIDTNNPAILGLCETHAYPELPDSLLCSSDYKVFRKDRNMFGGGVALLVHHSLFATEVILSEVYRNIEIVCVNIVMYGFEYLVIVYYRPPYFQQDDVAYCELSIQCFSDLIQRSSMHVILMGDFNLPDMDWSCYSAPSNVVYDMFTEFINEFGLSQFVHAPTRISDTGKGHILDLVITNTHDIISDINVQNPFCTSDHCIIQFQVNTRYTDTVQEVCNDELYYDFKNADYDMIESFLATVNSTGGMSFHLPSVLKTTGIFLYSGFIEQ